MLSGGQAIEQKDGSVTVSLPGGQVLVSADRAAVMSSNQNAVTGTLELTLTPPGGDTAVKIDNGSVGGALSGIIIARDDDIGGNLRSLDEYAFGLAQAVNDLHVQGFGLDGGTGRRLFAELLTVDGAASRIAVDPAMVDNPDAVATTRDSNLLPGGSDLVLELAGLRDTKVTALGNRSVIQGVNDFQTEIGRVLNMTRGSLDSADAEVATMASIRESTRGVSLDEELADLMKFQRSFEAASRVIRTADEMMTTVLQLMS
jgi:flagellar hook-associated protein 1 FlgK